MKIMSVEYTKHKQYTVHEVHLYSIHAVYWLAHNMSYSGHTVNTFSICDAWLVYMKYSVYICGTDILHN